MKSDTILILGGIIVGIALGLILAIEEPIHKQSNVEKARMEKANDDYYAGKMLFPNTFP